MNLGYDASDGSLLNLDGDVLVYRIGFTTQEESEKIALVRLNAYIDEILQNSKASDYKVYLSCPSAENFRLKLYPHYKQGRPPKPLHYQALRDYLIQYENAYVAVEQEADDELGINQTENTICGSNDKDLLMIPGRHFNFVKNRFTYITPEEGIRNFYKQLLTGDDTDKIPGIYGVGPAKAENILGDAKTEEEYKLKVLAAYKDHFPYCSNVERYNHINMVGKLLWIKRTPDDDWRF